MIFTTQKIKKINGTLNLPGDKSISHRAVMFASMAEGKSTITNCLRSEDLFSSINAFRALGCEIDTDGDIIVVNGRGFNGFSEPLKPIDCGNSGTTTRLISGILAAQKFSTSLFGDESLSKRPMKRIVDPLTLMGAKFELNDKFTLPMTIHPADTLHSIEYRLPVASAQVKSAVLLAGLFLDDKTCVIEEIPTRNHTEVMLGLESEYVDGVRKIYSSRNFYPVSNEFVVPSDISSAAFFIVLTLISDDSELLLKNVLLNPTRTGVLDVLTQMGGEIEIVDKKMSSGEFYGDILVRSSKLKNINIEKEIVPNIIDEIPILSIAGLFADGPFTISNAEELRHKESDRIKAMCDNYRKLGLNVSETEDGFSLSGEIKYNGELIESLGDHRIAMSFGVLGAVINQPIKINRFECVAVSNPDFTKQLNQIGSF